MKKPLYILLLIILLSLIGITVYYLFNKENEQTSETNTDIVYEEENVDENIEEKEHSLKLTIISPEEETFIPRQARMYDALLEGNQKYEFAMVRCNWKFYLNENNQESLIQEMDNSSVMSGESKEICGFTSTFIDRVGVLRVVLEATLYNAVEDLESVTAEKTYTVVN